MADAEPRNTPDAVANTQDLHAGEQQISVLNRNITRLNEGIDKLAWPPRFSIGEIVAICVLVLTIIGGALGAFALSDRIGKVDDHIKKAEGRVGGRLDKLDDCFIKLDEEVTRFLGSAPAPAKPHP